jgi:hypothetical protein
MFRHMLTRVNHPADPIAIRYVCFCGWSSPWTYRRRKPDHPDWVWTVSKDDLRPVSAVGKVVAEEVNEDGWVLTYSCGCKAIGIGDFDLQRARRNHAVNECRKDAS